MQSRNGKGVPRERECRELRDDEFDGIGNPKDAIEIKLVEHVDLMGRGFRYWVAHYPTLPGYDGEGVTPADALAALQMDLHQRPIYRVKPPRDGAGQVSRWLGQQRAAQDAAASLKGVSKSSDAIGQVAKGKVGAPAVRNVMDAALAQSDGDLGSADHLIRTLGTSQSRAMASALNAQAAPHQLLKRWARAQFPVKKSGNP